MAEKLTRKEKIALQQKAPGFSPKEIEKTEGKRKTLRNLLGLVVALTGFLLYANTVNHDYVLDDYGLIKDNTQVKQGITIIPEIFKTSYRYGMNITDYSLYRPITKAMFAIEWDMAPDTPSLSHWINVLLYAFAGYLLFIVLSRYMKREILIPFITSLLFISHPIHTEVVANIKSRDEILSFLFLLASAYYFYRYVTEKEKQLTVASGLKAVAGVLLIIMYFTETITGVAGLVFLAVAGVLIFNSSSYIAASFSFLLAMFTKESSITFLAVMPLLFYFFTTASKSNYFKMLGGMFAGLMIFLLVRSSVLEDVKSLIPMEDNSLVGIKNVLVQRANAVYIMGVYLFKMIVPIHLVSDGSFNSFPPLPIFHWKVLSSIAVFVGAAVYAIMNFKKKKPASFAILYFFVTASIISNVIILIGTNYGERLMFMPSLGFCMLVAILISFILKSKTSDNKELTVAGFFKSSVKPISITAVVVILFGFQTIARNMDWKDNLSLYTSDIEKVPNSAHMLFYYANHLSSDDFLKAIPDSMEKNKTRMKAIEYLDRAVTIYPTYADGYQRRGFIYKQLNKIDLAESDYKKAIESNPSHPIAYNNYGSLCFEQDRIPEARELIEKAVLYNPRYVHALNNMGSVYGVYGENERRLMASDPGNAAQHQRQAREFLEKAITYFLKAIDADPDFGEPYRMIAITYKLLGDNEKGERYDKMYKEVMARSNVKN